MTLILGAAVLIPMLFSVVAAFCPGVEMPDFLAGMGTTALGAIARDFTKG